MNKFVILTDATSDLGSELRKKYGIEDLVKAHVIKPDGTEVEADCDWSWITPKEFYKAIKKKNNGYSTSPASIDEYKEAFKKYLDQGFDVLSISISTGLSGTYNFCLKAKEQIEKDYPKNKIVCIDSLRYSVALGLLVIKAAQLRKEGKNIDEVAKWLNENKNNCHQAGPMEDLFFLATKGRVKGAQAFMGNLIGIRPMGEFNQKGLPTVLVKAKGKKKAMEAVLGYMKETIIAPETQNILIAHTQREESANELKKNIIEMFHPLSVDIIECSPSCGINIGPGLWGAYYLGTPISETLEKEKSILEKYTK